jgi:hypothetical protein
MTDERAAGQLTTERALRASTRRWLTLVLAVALVGLTAGCRLGPPPTKKEFNDHIVLSNRKLAKAGTDFNKALHNWFQKKGKVEAVRTAYNEAEKVVQEINAYYEDAPLPRKKQAAETLLEEYKKYLKVQNDILGEMKTIADAADNIQNYQTTKVDPAEEMKKLQAAMRSIKAQEKTALASLEKAQKSFAEALNFTLVEKYEVKK